MNPPDTPRPTDGCSASDASRFARAMNARSRAAGNGHQPFTNLIGYAITTSRAAEPSLSPLCITGFCQPEPGCFRGVCRL